MDATGPIEVRDTQGARAIVEAGSRHSIGRGQVALLMEDGQRVMVPGDLLEERGDGTYFLPLTLAELRTRFGGTTRAGEGETLVVPVVEEQLDVHKRSVDRGTVRVEKRVHEREEVIDEPLIHEDVEIERVPVGRQVDGPIPVRYDGDTMIVPLMEEVLVVEKRLVLREELRITRRRTEVHEVRRETVRAEEARVERVPRQTSDATDGRQPG